MLSLAGLVVEGPDWVLWKDLQATQRYWEGQDGFACTSSGDACVCNGGQGQGGVQSELYPNMNKFHTWFPTLLLDLSTYLLILIRSN